MPANRIVLEGIFVQIHVGFALLRSASERQQSAQWMRAAVVASQCRDLKKGNAPASLGNRLVTPVVVWAFDVCVTTDP